MERIEELLPGLEEFLTLTLAAEPLTSQAEERRRYFVERLDIVKLPPTLPPREGRKLSPELLKETELSSGVLSSSCQLPASGVLPALTNGLSASVGAPSSSSPAPDFAAAQREIARSLALDRKTERNPYEDEEDEEDQEDGGQDVADVTSPGVVEEEEVAAAKVKEYDDIEIETSAQPTESVPPVENEAQDVDVAAAVVEDEEEEDHYEIPVVHLEGGGGSMGSVMVPPLYPATGSMEHIPDDVMEVFCDVMGPPVPPDAPPPIPPPLPRRRDIRFSDSGSKTSLNAEVERPPDLPFRPPLPKRNEMYSKSTENFSRSDKSLDDRSDNDLSGGDSTSYESFDEDDLQQDTQLKLPKKIPNKREAKKHKKLSKSRSSSQWEITQPFRKLDNMDISGELFHKGKLSWNRRLVAISGGCLVLYKPDKDGRPNLVIQLTGYTACVNEREGKRGWELRIAHEAEGDHVFAVDFKDWAYLWMEHINGSSRGEPPAKYHTHLARTFTALEGGAGGSKPDLTGSNSNLSEGSEGGGSEDGTGKVKMRGKVMRMGSFAYRATQFFESIGKKSSGRRKISAKSLGSVYFSGEAGDISKGILEESSMGGSVSSTSTGHLTNILTPTSDISSPVFSDTVSSSSASLPQTPLSPGSSVGNFPMIEDFADATHKGYLVIFSTFNRRLRRWGKRWCLIRDNSFQLYKNQASIECELTFPLKPCTFMKSETVTPLGLGMVIMEGGREKVIVEPLSQDAMGPWVRALMAETSTLDTPDGLEAYMMPDPEVASLLSFTVLKQWDMTDLVPKSALDSHDYEDPVEVRSPSHLPPSPGVFTYDRPRGSSLLVDPVNSRLRSASDGEKTLMGSLGSSPEPAGSQVKFPRISDNLAAYNKNKQTTDSGFYSVRGNNSDSDSGCDNITKDTGDIDSGYATLNSHRSPTSMTPTSSRQTLPLCFRTNANTTTTLHSSNNNTSSLQSQYSTPSSEPLFPELSPSNFARPDANDTGHYDSLTFTPSPTEVQGQPEVRKGDSTSSAVDFPSPSEGCYSMVVPRSIRSKSKSPDPSQSLSSPSTTEASSEASHSSLQPVPTSCDSVMSSQDNKNKPESQWESTKDSSKEQTLSKQQVLPLVIPSDIIISNSRQNLKSINLNSSNGSEQLSTSAVSPNSLLDQLDIGLSVHPSSSNSSDIDNVGVVTHSSPVSQVESNNMMLNDPVMQSDNNVPESNISAVDSPDESPPPPLPTTPIPSPGVASLSFPLLSGDEEDFVNPEAMDQLAAPKVSHDQTVPESSSEANNGAVSPRAAVSNLFFKDALTPNSEAVTALASNPEATAEEVMEAIDALKGRLGQIKRRRMAVHDKRQRVTSDEEGLACEKEFAALDRAVEATDLDLGVLQNFLDVIKGQTLEQMKEQAETKKKKSGSRKKKNKRK